VGPLKGGGTFPGEEGLPSLFSGRGKKKYRRGVRGRGRERWGKPKSASRLEGKVGGGLAVGGKNGNGQAVCDKKSISWGRVVRSGLPEDRKKEGNNTFALEGAGKKSSPALEGR